MNRRSLPDIGVGRALELRTILQHLESCGVPWRSLARRSGLPDHIPEADTFLPTHLVGQFLGSVTLREALPELSLRAVLGAAGKLNAGTPVSTLGRSFLAEPSLLKAVRILAEHSPRYWSHFRFWLKETDRHVWVCSRAAMQPDAVGTEQQVQSRLVRVVGLIERYLGLRWRPEIVLLETRRVPSPLFVQIMDGARCLPGGQFSALPIPRDLLASSGPMARSSGPADDVASSLPAIDWTWLQRLRAVLPEYVVDEQLSIGCVADIACVSPRTLQRALADEGITFRDLLEGARFEVARQRLSDPAVSVAEVSELLGYSAPTHFARAFRRIAGRSPSDYREDLARSASRPGS
jgi:AraC-like DNA-binding protein